MGASQQELAKHLDLSATRVRELIKAGALRPPGKGGHNLDAQRIRYIRHLRAIASRHRSRDGLVDLTAERARLAREQANHQELLVAKAKGELVPREAVVLTLQRIVLAAREKLRAIPSRAKTLIPKLTRKDLARLLEMIDDALSELSEDGSTSGVTKPARARRAR